MLIPGFDSDSPGGDSARVGPLEELHQMRLHGELATAIRIHVVRLTIAFGVSWGAQTEGLVGWGRWGGWWVVGGFL